MRLDKYLKVSRIIKRRTVAKDAADQGRISINGKIAKAGDNVKVGDIIEIRFGNGSQKAEVLELDEKASKQKSQEMFKYVDWIKKYWNN